MPFTNGVWAPQPPRPTARPDWLIAADDILCQRLRHCTRCGRPNPQVVWTGVEEMPDGRSVAFLLCTACKRQDPQQRTLTALLQQRYAQA